VIHYTKHLARIFGDSTQGRRDYLRAKRRDLSQYRPSTKRGLLLGMPSKASGLIDYKAAHDDHPNFASGDLLGHFEGWASVAGVLDSYMDIVEPGAFADTIRNDLPMMRSLWQHNEHQALGVPDVVEERTTDSITGLWWRSPIINTSWGRDAAVSARTSTVSGISIGYYLQEYTVDKEGNEQSNGWPIWHLTKIRLIESSLVTYPANPMAQVRAFTDVSDNQDDADESQAPTESDTDEDKTSAASPDLLSGLLAHIRGATTAPRTEDQDR
jgi:HK97 family phage prohead protease